MAKWARIARLASPLSEEFARHVRGIYFEEQRGLCQYEGRGFLRYKRRRHAQTDESTEGPAGTKIRDGNSDSLGGLRGPSNRAAGIAPIAPLERLACGGMLRLPLRI